MAEHKWILPVAGGVAIGIVGLMLYQAHKAAASPTPTPTPQPAAVNLTLQPGATSVGIARGGTLSLALPSGASWSGGSPINPLAAGSTQPSGTQTENLTVSSTAGTTLMTATWTDSTGAAQTTTLNVSVV